jgi:Holliday junction resolvasome RuvABC DNA-binding subunit
LSQGGTHTRENITSLCESHHIAHHTGALLIEGTAPNLTFTRRAQSTFTTAERVVDTTRALRELCFDKREVAVAMEKTRTHVGTKELSLEQWVKIALGYCPRPIS